jgi:hypothetical protein
MGKGSTVIRGPNLLRNPDKKLLIFIGSARTGSTLLGQVLNYHPECLISNESGLIPNVVLKGAPLRDELNKVVASAMDMYTTGFENDKKFGKSINRYQSQWIPFGDLTKDPDFIKKNIIVIGDKKAGGSTKAYLERPEELISVLASHPNVWLLQIIREPVDAAVSYMKSHGVKPFQKACNEIIHLTHAAYALGKKVSNPYYFLYYEDLIRSSRDEITKILDWLNIDYTKSWLIKISQKIRLKEQSDKPREFYRTAENLIRSHNATEELGRYLDEYRGQG